MAVRASEPGPRSGDGVRAESAARAGMVVEGVLWLRHVPLLDYVQVLVVTDAGSVDVDPDTVQVIEPGVVPAAELERGDPLQGSPGWKRVLDLRKACAAGLVPPVTREEEPDWAQISADLDKAVQPLRSAGWRLGERTKEGGNWEIPPCLAYELVRDDERIEVQLFSDGFFHVYDLVAALAAEDDDTEPILRAGSARELLKGLRKRKWL